MFCSWYSSRANRQAPHHLIHSYPATLHTPGASPCHGHHSSPLLIPLPFRTLPPSTPAALFSPTARCSLTFLRSAHRATLCVCLTEHTVSAHFGHTHIQQGVCTVAPMSTHTYTYPFIKLIDMHSCAHATTNTHWFSYVHTVYTLIYIHRMSHTEVEAEIPVSVFLLLCFHVPFAVWSFNPLSITNFLSSSVPTVR